MIVRVTVELINDVLDDRNTAVVQVSKNVTSGDPLKSLGQALREAETQATAVVQA